MNKLTLLLIGIIWQITSGYYHTLDIYIKKDVRLPTTIQYERDKGYAVHYQDIRPTFNSITKRFKRNNKGFEINQHLESTPGLFDRATIRTGIKNK